MQNPFKRDLAEPVTPQDHLLGKLPADVRIAIYADFADPGFLTVHETLKDIVQTTGNNIAVAYRHLPGSIKHPQAYAVAQALEAAAKQDKFWEMVEQVLAHQAQLTDGFLRQYARAIDLDKAQFEDDFSSAETRNRIKQDQQSAKHSKVEQAPAIFINGVRQATLSKRYIQELTGTGGHVMG